MKSKVQSIAHHLDTQTGQQRTWQINGKSFYDYFVVFENAETGVYSSVKAGQQTVFMIGEEAEFTSTPNGNFPNKIKAVYADKQSLTGSTKGSTRSFALSYAKDVWVAKIAKGDDFKIKQCMDVADIFLGFLEAEAVIKAPEPIPAEEDDLPF